MLRLYLSRLFLQRMLGALFGLAAILQLLDLLDEAGTIVGRAGIAGIFIYVGLRLPDVLTAMVPLATLIGALLTFVRLAGALEMTAMQSAGLGNWQILGRLMPAGLLICLCYLGLQAELAPRGERAFADWWARVGPPAAQGAIPNRLWLRDRGEVAAIDAVSLDGRKLDGVLIIQRSPAGDLTGTVEAKQANFVGGQWRLADVQLAAADQPAKTRQASATWPNGPLPGNMIALSRPVASETLGHLLAILAGTRIGARGPGYYWTELNGLIAAAVSPGLMILLAAPVLIVMPRSEARRLQLGTTVMLGLAYMAVAGLLGALGGAGVLAPVVAAWTALLVFVPYGILRCVPET